MLSCVEICAGGGGQALGLEAAGFDHNCLVEIDASACATLRHNRPHWNVREGDVRDFDGTPYRGMDLLAGGVPCPPFSMAGKRLGQADERDLFPEALRLVREIRPKALMLENVWGFLSTKFEEYRASIVEQLNLSGYTVSWRLLHASDYGVPQLRPRVLIVALRQDIEPFFSWPEKHQVTAPTVGEALYDLMAANGWKGAKAWADGANSIAPTLVGGSKKHGGADLGPTRAKEAWKALGVNGKSLAAEAPDQFFTDLPRLTLQMAARIQGFPDSWTFEGKKTAAYRQIGNSFPAPVAESVAKCIAFAIKTHATKR